MPPTDPPLDFPPLFGLEDLDPDRWRWPKPPYVWHHAAPTAADQPQPCRVETTDGQTAVGTMEGFDPAAGRFGFRGAATQGRQVDLQFRQCRRLTLLEPLRPEATEGVARVAELLPLAEHEHAYTLQPKVPGAVLAGRSVGVVETPEGLFLFEPVDGDQALQRVFVPRAANGACELTPAALELAMRGWAATPAALVALEVSMRQRPVPRLGDSVLSLGLLTPAQLALATDDADDTRPLGQKLLARGLISAPQLQAAIAHKMGCPVADVSRFVPDPAALALLPQRLAMSYRTLPLCLDEGRLFVACDQALGEEKQRSIQVFVNMPVVPVLARSQHLSAALQAVAPGAWSARAI